MNNYTYEDIKSAFLFGKQNPKLNIEDWINNKSLFLSEKDIENFKSVKFNNFKITIDGNKYHNIYLFKSNSSVNPDEKLRNFVTKFVGNREYYEFIPNGYYGDHYLLISFDEELFVVDNWELFEDYKDVKYLKSDDIELMINLINPDVDSNKFDSIQYVFRDKEREKLFFWNYGSDVRIYIDRKYNDYNYIMNPITELFNV